MLAGRSAELGEDRVGHLGRPDRGLPLGGQVRGAEAALEDGVDRGLDPLRVPGPADALDTPIGYGPLAAAGAILGSGTVVVVDQSTCLVDLSALLPDCAIAIVPRLFEMPGSF